jgi:hypothetical protein
LKEDMMINEKKTWRATATVSGGKFLGEVEAETAEEALGLAEQLDTANVSLCHQCTDQCEDAQIANVTVERQNVDGEWITHESEPDEAPTLRAKVADLEKQVAALGAVMRSFEAGGVPFDWPGVTVDLHIARVDVWVKCKAHDALVLAGLIDCSQCAVANAAARFVDVDSDEMASLVHEAVEAGVTYVDGVEAKADICDRLVTAFKANRLKTS